MSDEVAPPYASLEDRCRQALQADTGLEELVGEFSKLNGEQRIAAWSWLTRNGVQDMDFARFVHRNFASLVLEVFNPSKGEKVT